MGSTCTETSAGRYYLSRATIVVDRYYLSRVGLLTTLFLNANKYDFPGLTFRNVLEIPVLARFNLDHTFLLLTNYKVKVY